jgi:hypothetical protein
MAVFTLLQEIRASGWATQVTGTPNAKLRDGSDYATVLDSRRRSREAASASRFSDVSWAS